MSGFFSLLNLIWQARIKLSALNKLWSNKYNNEINNMVVFKLKHLRGIMKLHACQLHHSALLCLVKFTFCKAYTILIRGNHLHHSTGQHTTYFVPRSWRCKLQAILEALLQYLHPYLIRESFDIIAALYFLLIFYI